MIPGCGDKKALFKPGAEKLLFTFRLVPDIHQEIIDLPNEHREYRTKVNLSTQSGIFLGSGVGSCSTMEGKYRFRTGEVKPTGKPVPPDYWNERKSNPKKAQASIGGRGFSIKKVDGVWEVVIQGERVEHDNPADNYNTCLKMSKKRALVDACLTVTAASDIFEQDIEELEPEDIQPRGNTASKPAQQKTSDKKLSDEQSKLWVVLIDYCKNDVEKAKATIKEMTSFVTKSDGKKYKKGETVPGKDSIYDVSDAACKVTRHKIEDMMKKPAPEPTEAESGDCSVCEWMQGCELTRKKGEPCESFEAKVIEG